MFIRTKKIKNKEYAFLVDNKWDKKSKKVKQKVIRYLGKVYKPKQENKNFIDFYNIESIEKYSKKDFKKIIKDLIEFEIKTSELRNKVKLNYEKQELKINGRNAVLKINQGYLCSYTIKNLLHFKKLPNEEEKQLGLRLAKSLVNAGIRIPKELFVRLCEKFF